MSARRAAKPAPKKTVAVKKPVRTAVKTQPAKRTPRTAATLQLPRAAARYITFQRFETQSIGKSIHYNAIGQLAYKVYEKFPLAQKAFQVYSTQIEPRLRAGSILESYAGIMRVEMKNIAPHLPAKCDRIIGIGAGVGGLEILMAQHYRAQGQTPVVTLIDKTGIDKVIKFGFKDKAAVYNSLPLSKQALEMNGHPGDKVELVDAEDAAAWAKKHQGQVDVVSSLIAWGFHFPVKTYLKLVTGVLKPTGCLIIDVRKGTTGLNELNKAFGKIEIILDDAKFDRALCTKPVK